MFRTILCLIIAFLYLIITLPVVLYFKLIEKKHPERRDHMAQVMIRWVFRVFLFISGISLKVIGTENIPKDQAVLFIGNHRSYLDVILGYPTLPEMTGFIAKNDFTKVPIMPIMMRRLYCQFLIDGDLRQNLQSILAAIDNVNQGVSMYIYPEGKRGTGEDERELLEFHEGSFKIATKTKCPIVPVAIVGSRERFESQFPKARAGHVIIEYGTPIEVEGMSREDLKGIGAKCRRIVAEMVQRNHDRL